LGMLPYFANMPACETNEQTVDAENWSPKEIFTLREQLFACPDTRSGLLLIEQYLLRSIRKQDFYELEKIKWMNRAIQVHSVTEICVALGVTRKRLREESFHHFGSSVKNMQGIIRLNQTLHAIAHHAGHTLSSLHDYYDQPHFINDFKSRTGITPGQYKKLCRQFPAIRYTPNFLPLQKETFLQFIGS
jgi:AraC-like DNA-binding protein